MEGRRDGGLKGGREEERRERERERDGEGRDDKNRNRIADRNIKLH